MERVNWSVVDYVSLNDLDAIENKMSLEELREMKKKTQEIIGCMYFRDATERLIATNAFKLGYLAMHTNYVTIDDLKKEWESTSKGDL